MPTKADILSKLWKLVTVDAQNFPQKILNQYYNPPVGTQIGAVKADGTTTSIDADGTIHATTAVAGVTSIAVNAGGIGRNGALRLLAGQNVTLVDNGDNSFSISASGGGGGGNVTIATTWASGGTSKNQYTSPGVVNAQGVNLGITLSSGSAVVITGITIGGVAVTGTPYTPAGTFPNFTLNIGAANVPNAAQLAGGIVNVQGTLDGANFFTVSNALNTNPPVPFTSTLTIAYVSTSVPFYNQVSDVTWSFSNSSNITVFGGTVTIAGLPNNLTAPSGTLTAKATTGGTLSGSITGTGTAGAGTSTITLSGSQPPAIAPYTPAFWAQTSTSAQPTFTTASNQTAGDQVGSQIVYPVATSTTQYNWVLTTRPLANLALKTPFGNFPLIADITGSQVLSGVTFALYGWSSLTVGQSSTLIIS